MFTTKIEGKPGQEKKRSRILPILMPLLSLFVVVSLANAGISVAPAAIYLKENDKRSSFDVRNDSPFARTFSIEMMYGYPVSDRDGNVSFRFVDPSSSNDPFAYDWIQIYPKEFELVPGETQTVAVIARPSMDLKDGEYWARPIVISRPVNDGDGIEEHVALALNYRKGNLQTGIRIENFSATKSGNTLTVYVDLKRTGNAAYIGNLNVSFKRTDGKTYDVRKEIAVYHDMRYRIDLDLQEFSSVAEVIVDLNTNRMKINRTDLIQSPPITQRFSLDGSKESRFSGSPKNITTRTVNNTKSLEPNNSSVSVTNKTKSREELEREIETLKQALIEINSTQERMAELLRTLQR